MSSTDLAPVKILLVEDNPADILITREAFAQFKVINNLPVVQDGEAALAFLRQQGRYAGMPHPDLVLLDLHLPGLPARELLAALRADPHTHRIPVMACVPEPQRLPAQELGAE